tara:strand:+ start:44 stop:853 length:810 start_codon:yes stop_codon:yes gene_type:complete
MGITEKCQPHLWLLTGTGEGYIFAKSLLKEGWRITISVVSDRASIPYEKLNLEEVLIGTLITEENIREVILKARSHQNEFHCVVDLTHPFAIRITRSISKVCEELGQPFIRYERAIENISNAFLIEKFSDLRNYDLNNKSILLAVGVRQLQEALNSLQDSGANVYARVLANPGSIRKTLSSSIQKTNFAVLNPTVLSNGEIEKALVRNWNIDCVICRQSGGKNENLWHRICLSMGINLWLLERPTEFNYIESVDSYEKLTKRLKSISIE